MNATEVEFILEEEMGGLVMLSTDKLYPHPDNLRKALGDLKELSESIKAKGVMQNLTVVPRADEYGTYTIIIGHRRHAAAKMAGVAELPCVVVDMDYQEQLATMLLENIQRSDLTAYEQAKGFQMMMDFGDSVSGIVKKTGFSESTVRRRLKMAELDEEVLKKVSGRQISFGDIDKLSEIEDLETRNKVLADIGTANFNISLKTAVDKQKLDAILKEMREAFNAAGLVEISGSEYTKWCYETCICGLKDIEKEISRAKERGATGYYYSYRETFYMMYKKDEQPKAKNDEGETEYQRSERERKERVAKLEEAFERAYQLRREFIDNYAMSSAMKNLPKIAAFLACMGFNEDFGDSICKEDFEKMVFGDLHEVSSYEEMFDLLDMPTAAAKAMLVSVWLLTDSEGLDCCDWQGMYRENEVLNMIYEFLESLGYEMSDEERELIEGKSELYKSAEAE
jgi:ParB family chromosome partitioning protein